MVPLRWFLTKLCLLNLEKNKEFTFRSFSQQPLQYILKFNIWMWHNIIQVEVEFGSAPMNFDRVMPLELRISVSDLHLLKGRIYKAYISYTCRLFTKKIKDKIEFGFAPMCFDRVVPLERRKNILYVLRNIIIENIWRKTKPKTTRISDLLHLFFITFQIFMYTCFWNFGVNVVVFAVGNGSDNLIWIWGVWLLWTYLLILIHHSYGITLD